MTEDIAPAAGGELLICGRERQMSHPAGWSHRRLKFVATYNDEVLPENTDDLTEIQYVEISGVSLIGGLEEVIRLAFYNAPSRARRRVRSGDILISTVRTYLRAIAAIKLAPDDLIASTGFCVVRPGNAVDSEFLGWVAKSEPFVSEVVARSVGVSYPAINSSELVTINVPLPPLIAQRRIAAFLNEKTARIDGLIAKKRALLERLAEKHQALIARAVTKGLNPDTPMKPSGIDWIGDVPRHWDICAIGQKLKLQRGVDITRDERVDGDVPVVSSGGIDYFHDLALCSGPGVLVGRKGSAGKLHYLETPYWPHDTTLYVREFRGNSPRFVWYLLHCLDLTSLDTGSSNPTVNRNRIHPMRSVWPELDEQDGIVEYLDRELSAVAEFSEKIQSSCDRLGEYRSALITAAISGRIADLN